MSQSIDLPVVDVSCFTSTEFNNNEALKTNKRDAAARAMMSACETFGAFNIVGHGLDNHQEWDKIYQAASNFFNLDQQIKDAISIQKNKYGFTRGYIGIGGESGSDALEVKEAFSYGYPWDNAKNGEPRNPLEGANVYPAAQEPCGDDWRETLEGFYHQAVNASQAITRCMAHALGRREDIVKQCEGGETISLMRIFRYFPYTLRPGGIPDVDRIGSSPHTDWGFLTLIASRTAGLQIQLFDNELNKWTWRTVNPYPKAFTVNAGDYLSLITQGRILSPLHRVVTATQERTSFVFFYYPNYDAQIDAVDVAAAKNLSLFVDQSHHTESQDSTKQKASTGDKVLDPESIKGVSFGEYISGKWASVFRDGKSY